MNTDEIRNEIDLINLVESYGIVVNRNRFCCCPFHKEKTPSMKIYKTNTFYCFGCGKSGDVFKFVEYMENCDFKTAFLRLGGFYDKTSDREKIIAQMRRKRQKNAIEMKRKHEDDLKNKINFVYEFCRQGESLYEVGSADWQDCINYKERAFQLFQMIIEGEEVKEDEILKLYSKFRQKLIL